VIEMRELVKELVSKIEELEKSKENFDKLRCKYKTGSPYECFLAGVVQGIHYALNYPRGAICIRSEIEGVRKTG